MLLAELSKSTVQESYQENSVFTAGREELILMLYNGAIKFTNQGLHSFDEPNWGAVGWNLVRAQKIVHYLDMCLNFKQGQDLAKKLSALYQFILSRLANGYLSKNREFVQDALGLLHTLRDAWQESMADMHSGEEG
jgi:flagellar secretion chaperone FliS